MTEEYTRETRTKDLISMLEALRQPDCDHERIKAELDGIYFDPSTGDGERQEKPYRHSYSDISSYIYNVCFVDDDFDSEPLSCIIDNLDRIIQGVSSDERLYGPLIKLYDHLSLESIRFSQQESVYVRLQRLQDTNEQLNQIIGRCESIVDALAKSEQTARLTQGKLNEQENKISSQQARSQEMQRKLDKQQEELTTQQEKIAQQSKEVGAAVKDIANANTQSITVLSGCIPNSV